MTDGQRIYPTDELVIHHSMGPSFFDASDLTVQDWFSNTGKARAYNNGAINSYHEHPSRPGELTYAQAQFAGVPCSITPDNKYGYRIVTLIALPWDNVAWHCGNWYHNQKSIGIECCGSYVDQYLTDKQLMCIADFYRFKDVELGGNTAVFGHQEIFATACPARIMEQRDKLVDMINNPDKWNSILWPVPVITTKYESSTTVIPFVKESVEDNTKDFTETITTGINGSKIITYVVTYIDGVESNRTIDRINTINPVNEITVIGTYKPPVINKPEDTTPVDTVKPVEVPSLPFAKMWAMVLKFIQNIKLLFGKDK